MTAHRNSHLPKALALAASVVTAVALLAACNKADDNRTAGQKLDGAIATAQTKADDAKADMSSAATQAKESAASAANAVATTSRDLTITAEVKAKLAGDKRLSALRIDVDTTDGRVVLKGSAPDSESRKRAAEIALAVSGVVSVENHLDVKANG